MPWLKWKSELSTTMYVKHVCASSLYRSILPVGVFRRGLGFAGTGTEVEQVGRLGLSLEGMRTKILRLCDQEMARQRTL